MNHKSFETRLIWGTTLSDCMNGVEAMKKDGWHPLGTPYPCHMPHLKGYGMMHLVIRDRERD